MGGHENPFIACSDKLEAWIVLKKTSMSGKICST